VGRKPGRANLGEPPPRPSRKLRTAIAVSTINAESTVRSPGRAGIQGASLIAPATRKSASATSGAPIPTHTRRSPTPAAVTGFECCTSPHAASVTAATAANLTAARPGQTDARETVEGTLIAEEARASPYTFGVRSPRRWGLRTRIDSKSVAAT
jgi:hypothetical protein